MGRQDNSSLLMRDLMAYQDDETIKVQSSELFTTTLSLISLIVDSSLVSSLPFFIIYQLSRRYYKNVQTIRGFPLLIIQTMQNATLR